MIGYFCPMAMPESRKDQVVHEAAMMFREKGYAATSMRDLANKLGIEAASLYSHIRSKEEILQILCFTMAEKFMHSLDQVEIGYPSYAEKLREGILGHIGVISDNLTASAVFMNEHRHLSDEHLRQFLLLRINYINRFKRIIQGGVHAGEFKNVDTKLAVMTLFSSLNWMPHWYDPKGIIQPEILGNQLADMLIEGLKTK
jgi:AcrR family transcriptional regulator